MQEAQDLAIRAVDRGLVVGDVDLGAVGAHDLVGAADVAARHGGKQVVLDLVVERSVEEVGERIGPDVARGQDL